MWAAHDNGKDISFKQAGAYLKLFRLAGYDTWRFPTVQELETIHTKGQVNSTPPGAGCAGKYEIHPFFKLTCCCPWALEEKGRRPASYPFVAGMATETMWHHHTKYSGNRILPVRDLEDGWKPN